MTTDTAARLDETAVLDRLATLLVRLGNNPTEIAGNLRKLGITGRRYSWSTHNPIVAWLRTWGMRADALAVCDNALLVWLVNGTPPHSIDLPLPLRHWMFRWERGQYRDLEDGAS